MLARIVVLLFGLLGLSCERAAIAGRSSIVFVSVDTLAARHTSLHGYERPTTPGLDSLAERSVVFERCWANAPWTTPSYISQFTGLLPASFVAPGEPDPKTERWSLPPEHSVIAEVLLASGYRTAAFVDNPNAGALYELDRGFEYYDDSPSRIGLDQLDGGVELASALALEWLGELKSEEPFFLFLQVLDVHGPYHSGAKWTGEMPRSSVVSRQVPISATNESILSAIPKYIADAETGASPASLPTGPILDDYDRGVRAMDDALTDFLTELGARGLLDRAWLFISADHGESMVEHDSYFNHQLLHGEELHVPLIIRPPGGTPARRVQSDVQLVDLFPTILEIAGVAPRAQLHGRSLLPAIQGAELDQRPAFAFGDFEGSRSIVDNGWKLVETNPTLRSAGLVGFLSSKRGRGWIDRRFPDFEGKVFGTHELPIESIIGLGEAFFAKEAGPELFGPFRALYDLDSDPGELIDVSADHPEQLKRLLDLLDREEAKARALYIEYEPSREVAPELRDSLESLGYVSSEE